MNDVIKKVSQLLGDPVATPSLNWIQHNCPACVFNGQPRADTRKRGNHRYNSDGGFQYNCFNCGLKVGWVPGKYVISNDFATLLTSVGASRTEVHEIRSLAKAYVEEAKANGGYDSNESLIHKPTINRYDLPENTRTFTEWMNEECPPAKFVSVLEAVYERNPYLLTVELLWSPEYKNYMSSKFIIPYYYNNSIIGYVARDKDKNSKFRYYNQVNTGIIFNHDLLYNDRVRDIYVLEGELDAMMVGGIAVGNNTLTRYQIHELSVAKDNGKNIILVPDRDKDSKVFVNQAIENNFMVSLPEFGIVREEGKTRYIKDPEEASSKYGRIFTMKLLQEGLCKNPFEIQFNYNKWL